jgi:hypothetical protein
MYFIIRSDEDGTHVSMPLTNREGKTPDTQLYDFFMRGA